MTKISGVVVLYNPEENLKKNIESYLDEIERLYVIDNTPNKSNKEKLPLSQKIKYIQFNENKGVSCALNKAAKEAIKEGYKWLLTMDQDSQFEKGELAKLTKYIQRNKDEKIGLVCPWHVIATNPSKPKEDIDYPIEVMTSGNIINLEAYKKVGGYKDWLFIDCIDFDYCMNLNINGYKVVRLNYAELKHHLGDICIKHFLGRDFVCSNHNYIRRYYMARNIYYICDLYRDNFPDYCQFLKRGLRGQIMNIILFEKDKYRKIRNICRGINDYKKGIKGVYSYKN